MTRPVMAAALVILLQILLAGTRSEQASDAAVSAEPVARPLPQPSTSAPELFARTRDGIVQARVLLASANEQSSLGSGSVVRADVATRATASR